MDSEQARALIRKAQRGDRAAFDDLVDGHRGRVESLIHSRMGSHLKRISDAEDVLQETLLRAFRSIDRFHWGGDDSFMRWLGGIAEHVILKLASRYERDQKISLSRDVTAGGVSPSRALRRDERFDRLQAALSRLSPDHRQVILLARVEGLRIKEIARRMKRTPDATMHLLSRAIRALRDSFGDTESLHLPPRSLNDKGGGDDRR